MIRRRVGSEARMTTKRGILEGMGMDKEYLIVGTKDGIYSSSPPRKGIPRKVGEQAVRHLSARLMCQTTEPRPTTMAPVVVAEVSTEPNQPHSIFPLARL